jgi:hypothetical protein
MHVEIPIQMGTHKRPDDLPVFQLDKFDSSQLIGKEIKQIHGAIDCFKIIHTCLKSYFDGQVHMYKPISVQLRMLFSDTSKRKDHSLINRIHSDIKLLAFKELKFEEQDGPISFATAPYSITEYANGFVDAKLDIAPPYQYLSLEDWRKQIVEIQPTLNLNDIIRSVADQDGGAHLDDNECSKLTIMREHNPTKIGSNILFIIALAHYVVDFANQLVPLWIQHEKINV